VTAFIRDLARNARDFMMFKQGMSLRMVRCVVRRSGTKSHSF
jgi:hypothetical protein